MTRKNIIFEINGLTFFSRLVDGEYIDYERIIVKNQKIQIDVLKSEFLEALQRAALITEERIAGNVRAHVKLELCENLLKILATSAAGSTYDEISVDYDGAPMSISFNNKYLMDSISACNCDKIKFSMSSPLTSVNIEPSISEEGTDEIYMLLPVRTKD
jgi:DNA polymerase-3 subunit beta